MCFFSQNKGSLKMIKKSKLAKKELSREKIRKDRVLAALPN